MNWKQMRGCSVRYGSGSKIGLLRELYIDDGSPPRIVNLKATPPGFWSLLRGELIPKPVIIPTESAHYRHPDIVVEQPGVIAEDEIRNLARIDRVNNSDVFAGRGWRIGRVVGIRFDPSSWVVEGLEIDAHPEYMLTTGTHSQILPKGFPPVARVSVEGKGVEIKLAGDLEKSTTVMLTVGGKGIEESLVECLMELGNRAPSVEDQADIVQEAFDRAYANVK